MYLEDESTEVRVAALRTMIRCDEGDPEVIEPLADSADKRLRAAAIAALARHGGEDGAYWFAQGLKDPDACVRLETASLLTHLDPGEEREIFELALYDPNPQVSRVAQKLSAGKGIAKVKW
jgi:HEAT repeat protein